MKTTLLALLPVLSLPLAACGGADSDADAELDGTPAAGTDVSGGKADNATAAEGAVVASCQGGALKVQRRGNGFVATITDPEVIASIEEQSTGSACGESLSGNQGCVTKRLPWQATIKEGVFELSDLSGSTETMSFSTSYPGSTVKREGDAMRLTLRNAELANSQLEVRYEISNVLFDACEFAVEGEPEQPEEPEQPGLGDGVVASCDDGAMIVEAVGDTFTATVFDPNIVAYFEQESTGTACASDGSGCVTKRLPWEATIEEGVFTLSNLNGSTETMRLITSYPGSTVAREGDGMKLELRNSQLASSHVEVRYEIANWYFSTCIFQ